MVRDGGSGVAVDRGVTKVKKCARQAGILAKSLVGGEAASAQALHV